MDEWTVITAAHCCSDEFVGVVASKNESEAMPKNPEMRKIQKMITHPKYTVPGKGFDICLIRVNTKFEFSESVRAVQLPKPGIRPKLGTKMSIMGMGKQQVRQSRFIRT